MEVSVGFSNGSYEFLKELVNNLNRNLSLSTSNLRKRRKCIGNKKTSITYMIEYYSNNAYKIIRYLYDSLKEDDLFLINKYQKQLKAREIYENLRRGTKLWREIEDRYKLPMKNLLANLYKKKGLNGVQIARELGVHSSSIYRWLEKTEIRKPAKRGSKIWVRRVKKNYLKNLLNK